MQTRRSTCAWSALGFVLAALWPALAQAQPTPTATVVAPAAPLIGETVTLAVTFDNTGSAPGYGPFVDLVLPATGADGAGAATDDGITFVSATYIGAPVTATVLTFNGAGNATHPYARTVANLPVVVTGTPGDQLVVLQLPFGSFTPTQPATPIQVTTTLSPLADANTALNVRARGGFQFGADALNNPPTDPSTLGAFTANQPVTPAVWRMTKSYVGPEDETATGPNFPRQYRIDVDIAAGQTVTALDLTDVLPGNLQFVAVVGTLVNGGPVGTTAVATPSTATPGGTLTSRFASVTGTASAQDASVIFSYFVPRVDTTAGAVIDPTSGDDGIAVNDASSLGNWTPTDGRDTATVVTSNVTANDHTLTPKSLAVQKAVTVAIDTGGAGPTPGDTLEYTLSMQVSDFFALQDLVLTDILSDGQRRDPGFVATLTIAEHSGGASAAAPMAAASATFVVSGVTGETTATFDVGAEQLSRGLDRRLIGGCVPAGGTGGPPPDCATFNGGATTVTIVYRAVIQENFSNTFPSGDPSVDHGDRLGNAVTAQADLLSVADPAVVTGTNEADTSGNSVTILTGTLTKSIYAINGSTSFPTARLGPGDTVTYRLRYTLPSSDSEPITITDYLPLPVLVATEVSGPFSATGGPGVPPAGTAKFGPGDTYFALSGSVPAVTTDAAGNVVQFTYPAFDDPANTPTAIEILFTVTASNQPFADGLSLTNQVRVQEGTTNTDVTVFDAIIQIQLNEPNVRVSKGVITTSNPADVYAPAAVGPVSFTAPGAAGYRGLAAITSNGLAANPVNSNVSALDAGDTVTFAVVLENLGSGPEGAFDVTFRDTLPAGFVAPANLAALNLSITDGNGAALGFTDLGGGAFGSGGGLFAAGLRLNDPSASQGALASYGATSATNIAIVTYDLVLDGAVAANQALVNTATLANFAGTEGGPDFTSVDLTDTATVTTAAPAVTKTITGTNQAHTAGNTVAIGEQVTYRVSIRVPEGTTPAATLLDVLDAGLALVSLDAITSSPALTAANGTFAAVLAAATVSAEPVASVVPANQGRRISLNFGTLTNTDTDNATAETITLDYTVVAINSAGNTRGGARNNAASFAFTGGAANGSAPNVTIVEPTLQIAKSAVPVGGDANDTVTFTVTLSHGAASNTTAFNAALTDVLPAGLTFVSASFQSGTAPTTLSTAGGVSATWDTFALGSTATFQIVGTIDSGIATGTVLTNTATSAYTSLPGTVTAPQSPFNALSTERTGSTSDPGGAANTYLVQGSAAVSVSNAAVTKVVVATNQAHTSGTDVAIGEILTYTVTVSVPEAVSNGVTLVDTLDAGLALVALDSLAVSNPGAMSTSIAGGFPGVLANAAVSNPGGANPETAGSRVTFNFGIVTNTDTNSGIAETVTLTYRAIVINRPANTRGQTRNNSAAWTAGGSTVTASAPDVTIVEPALAVTKTAAPLTGDANDPVTFTIVVAHSGPSNSGAFDVVLSDPIPAGITITGAPTAAGLAPASLVIAAGTLTGTWPSFPFGATSTITVTGTLDTSIAPGTVTTNTATATWTSLPGAAGVPLSPYNGLSVERTGNPAEIGGSANTYTSSDPATVTLNANTLAGRVYEDANNDGVYAVGEVPIGGVIITLTGTDHLGNAVSLTTVTLAAGTYQFTALRPGIYAVRETHPAAYADGLDAVGSLGGTLGNDVISAIDIPLGGPANAVDYNFGERPTADLQITKTDNPDPVVPGTTLTYTLVVRNNGPSVAATVVVRDPLPSATAFALLTAPGLTCTTPAVGASGDVTCSVATLAVGATTTLTLTVQVAPTLLDGAVITNAAAVRSETVDLVPANNTDIEPTTVAAPTSADLAITKTDAVDPVALGTDVVYTLTVRNNGPADATSVTVTDTLPAGVTLVSAIPSQGAACTGTSTVSCVLGALATGAQATVIVTVSAPTPGVIVNTASVTAAEPDPAPSNNTATEPTTIGNPTDADLRVAKLDTPDPVTVDGLVAYTIAVENRGPGAASSVVLTDAVPANTVFESLGVPAGWACTTPAAGATGTVSCGIATLAAGATASFDLRVRLVAGTPAGTTLGNTVIVISPTPDPDPANNTDTEPTLVVGPGTADLAIVKTDAPDPQAAGAPVSYTFTITNNGPVVATTVTVTDTLPAGTAVVSASSGCTVSAGVLSCAVGTLAPGASTAVGVTLSTPPLAGLLTNVAAVSGAETDLVPANDTEPEDTTLVQRADVRIAKTGPATAIAGAPVAYTITVANDGPSVADDVTVADPTPAGLTFVSTSGACSTAFPCLLGSMLPAEVRLITVTFQVPAGYTAPDPIVNVATVTTTTAGDNPANNSATASTPMAFSGDVAVAKSAGTLAPGVGTTFDYVVTVTNLGPSNVTGVVITDPLPAGVTYQSHLASTGAYVPGTALWTIPALAAGGGSATLTLTVRADQPGPLPNTATRTATDQPDPNPANDQATVTPVATANADVAVVKTGPTTVLAGGTVVYTLTVTNNGPAVAIGVVLADPTPPDLTFVSTAGACTTAFPCALGTMAVGEVRTITATYTAGAAPDGTVVTNIATVSSTSPDQNPANNQSTVPTTIVQRTDVGVTKLVAPAQVVVGAAITYTVTATNHGPNPATGIVVTDRLPVDVLYQSSTASQGAYDQVTGAWTVGALAVGQSATLTIGAAVQVPGPITNLAVRAGQNEPDSNPANDSAVAVVNSPAYADVGVAKSVVPASVIAGAPVTYTVVVTNRGPALAPAVVVDDPVPAGLALVSATPSVGAFVPANGRWTIGPLAVNASATLTLMANSTASGTIVNRAVIRGAGILDPNPLNDQDNATVIVGPPPAVLPVNLRLAKVALRPFVAIDDFAEFVVTVTNDGPGPATGVVVSEPLPANLVFVEAQTSQGLYNPGTGLWTVGALDASRSATLQITARVIASGTAVNTATITGSVEPDPDPSDNSGSATVLTPPPGAVDLEITQELPSVAPPNGLIAIRLVTRNLGPNVALNPYITGMIPPGTIFVAANPGPGGSCTVPGNPPPPHPVTGYPVPGPAVPPLTCTWPGLMQPGETRVLEFTVRVAPAIRTGQILWSCFFAGTETDEPYQPNNVVDGYLFVDDGASPVGDLAIQGAASHDGVVATTLAVPVGVPVQMRFWTTNNGPATARGQYALILDQANVLEIVGITTDYGWVAPNSSTSGVWDTGPIAPGQTVTLDLTVRLLTASNLKLFAQRVAGLPGDPNASNERATLVLDGYAAATGGRWVAVGNVDGAGASEIVTGTGRGETPQVRVFTGAGADTGLRYFAYERSFRGGVRIASCDVDGDGTAELITAPGPGRAPTVRVLRLAGGVVTDLVSFDAFESTFSGGLSVACADLEGDGSAEVVIGTGPGRLAEVKVYNVGAGVVAPRASFAAYEPGFLGGVRVAAGRYSGRPGLAPFDIATTPGPGRPAELRLWTLGGAAVAQAVVSGATAGVEPTLADANGDGRLDLIVALDDGRPELLRMFDLDSGGVLAEVPAGLAWFPSGVRIAVGRLHGGPGGPEIVVGNGPGGHPRVRVILWTPGGPVQRLEIVPLEVP